jgi:hypothetical protein
LFVFSSTKSVTRAEQDLPETEEVGGGKGEEREQGGEITQTMYAYVNKSTTTKKDTLKQLEPKKGKSQHAPRKSRESSGTTLKTTIQVN